MARTQLVNKTNYYDDLEKEKNTNIYSTMKSNKL